MPKVSDDYRASRRQQILDAAVECFARQGFHRTSMQDIFDESGLSAGAVYGYFAGKDDIVAAVADERHAQEAALVSSAWLAPTCVRACTTSSTPTSTGSEIQPSRVVAAGRPVWAEALRDDELAERISRGEPSALPSRGHRRGPGGRQLRHRPRSQRGRPGHAGRAAGIHPAAGMGAPTRHRRLRSRWSTRSSTAGSALTEQHVTVKQN